MIVFLDCSSEASEAICIRARASMFKPALMVTGTACGCSISPPLPLLVVPIRHLAKEKFAAAAELTLDQALLGLLLLSLGIPSLILVFLIPRLPFFARGREGGPGTIPNARLLFLLVILGNIIARLARGRFNESIDSK